MRNCLACDAGAVSATFTLREMFFGRRASFVYEVCKACESIQISTPLSGAELAAAYPQNYYAFKAPERAKRGLATWKLRQRTSYDLGAWFNLVGRHLSKTDSDWDLKTLYACGLHRRARILDIGCGNGALLTRLADRGFRHLTGVDPFIEKTLHFGADVTVHKQHLEAVSGSFSFIMFNHSLEHMEDPLAALTKVRDLLAEGGRCVVRLPTCSSEAYRHYGGNWIQLDPPRHVLVPSREGMRRLGERAGLDLIKTIDDSCDFQFWGSEQYCRDIALMDPRSHFVDPKQSAFRAQELAHWQRRAEELNRLGQGDQAAFVFEKDRRRARAA